MEDLKIKVLIFVLILIIIYFYNNSKKETFENLDKFIKSTNNGQWNFSSYNPYANLNEYTNSFVLTYSKSNLENYNVKELLKYNKDNLQSFYEDLELNNKISTLLNNYNNTVNKVKIFDGEFRKVGLEYKYTVPLVNAYDKLNYIKNKAILKDKINKFLIKDLKKTVINKYFKKYNISNEPDNDNNIIVELIYDRNISSLITFSYITLQSQLDNKHNGKYEIYILKKIKNYLKFDIIDNGSSIKTLNGTDRLDIKFKVITYDFDENVKSIINEKIEKLYDILLTDVLNTNDDYNFLNIITETNTIPTQGEKILKNLCIYGSGLCKITNNIDISPNCSVPRGDKTILNRYEINFKKKETSQNYYTQGVGIGSAKQVILNSIRSDGSSGITTAENINNAYINPVNTGNHKFGYNCNVYDINYNLNNNEVFTLDIYDNFNHFDSTKSIVPNKNIYTHHRQTQVQNHAWAGSQVGIYGTSSYGILNSKPTAYFDTIFDINKPDSGNTCIGTTVNTSSSNIEVELKALKNIRGLDKLARNNVKAILYANLSLSDFKNYAKKEKSKTNYDLLVRLRTLGLVFKFLDGDKNLKDGIKNLQIITNAIKAKLDNLAEPTLDITVNKLYGALHYIMEKQLRTNNNEFKLNEELLFNNTSSKTRYEIIKAYIPENSNSELEKLTFMTSSEKVFYFDENKNTKNPIELELKLIEKMTNSELQQYFKDVNSMSKDVNDRLKIIVSKNSNNILRIHKKLNNLSGGYNKLTGGTINRGMDIPSSDNCIGVGTIIPQGNYNSLLLNNYNNMSLKEVTSNLNHIAYYNNKLYIIGNSGYFTIYNLIENTHKTAILYTPSETNRKIVKTYEDLKCIHINEGKCTIVGNNGTIIYNSDLDTTTTNFILYKKSSKYNFKECLINNTNIYIITTKKAFKIDISNISADIDSSVIDINPSLSNFSNLFINKIGEKVYCFAILNNTTKQYIDLTVNNGVTKNYSSTCMSYNADIFIQYNTHTNIIYNDNYVRNKINFDLVKGDISDQINCVRMSSYMINTDEKITSVFLDGVNAGGISDKLNYYHFNNSTDSNFYNINIKSNSNNNIAKSKLYCLPNGNNKYSNIIHYGSAGQILNYNINHQQKSDITLTNTNINSISPNLNGYDTSGNLVYTFNVNDSTIKKFNIEAPTTDLHETNIRLSGNQNTFIEDKDKIKLIRYNYNILPENNDYIINFYSIIDSNLVLVNPIALENITYNLLSNNFKITVNRVTKRNKNEFVSVALFINNSFKIWLKPEASDTLTNTFLHTLNFNNDDTYKLKLYVNGTSVKTVILNKVNTESNEIIYILHNGINVLQNNIITIKNIVNNNYSLVIIPESLNATILYKENVVTNRTILLTKDIKTITIGIKNGNTYKSHKFTLQYGDRVISNLKDFELDYVLEIDVNEAYKYLNKVNKNDLTLQYLLQKYRTGAVDDVQLYLVLITDKSNRDTLENNLINLFTDEERNIYIQKYLLRADKPIIPTTVTSDKIVDVKPSEQEELLKSLKIKLDKMKIEKEVLSNQYKIEQRNRMFESMDAEKLVKQSDIDKLDDEIKSMDKVLEESKTKKAKSKTFFQKLLSFFSSEETTDNKALEKTEEENKKIIEDKKQELKKQLEDMDAENQKEIEKLEKEHEVEIKKLKLENKIKLENQQKSLQNTEQLSATELDRISGNLNNEINNKNEDLEIKKDIIQNERINLEMDKLFNVQRNLVKKQKSLLKIIKSQPTATQLSNTPEITQASTVAPTPTTASTSAPIQTSETISKENENMIQNMEVLNENYNLTKNLIKDFSKPKEKQQTQSVKENKIKLDILDELDEEIKSEKKVKKGKKQCTSFIDCYFKNLDDDFYTSYKKENTFIKNAQLPKQKKPTCKPKKDCKVCYLETEGIPNSIRYRSSIDNTIPNSNENSITNTNENLITNTINNNGMSLSITGNVNSHFTNDYNDLPDCPFDTCMSCEDINNFSSFNDKTFNDKLIKKWVKK